MTLRMFLLKPKVLFTLAFLIIIVSNTWLLIAATLNRSGPPTAMLALSERELSLPSAYNNENSGLALRIKWRVANSQVNDYSYFGSYAPDWLDEAKLNDLDVDLTGKQPWPEQQVFLVLELNGKQYQNTLTAAQQEFEQQVALIQADTSIKDGQKQRKLDEQRQQLTRQQHEYSRLFVIDAGLNPEHLLELYNDPQQYIITKGIIRAYQQNRKNKLYVYGQISSLSVPAINVPLEHNKLMKDLQAKPARGWQEIKFPRYQVTVAYGQRFEPWIEQIQAAHKLN